jgi:signal transduction histidine kinase
MHRIAYWGTLAAALAMAILAGYTTLAEQLDNDVYDFVFRAHGNKELAAPTSAIYGIDEAALRQGGGVPKLRAILADGLERLVAAQPKAVVIDLILADAIDPLVDARLAAVLRRFPKVVLAAQLLNAKEWEGPRAEFSGVWGHVHADPDPYDNTLRQIPLEKASGQERHWALSMEAARAADEKMVIDETPRDLHINGVSLPSVQQDGRPMLVRYRPAADPIPQVGMAELASHPQLADELTGRVVFVGLTAQSAAQDRHATPVSFGQTMVGVEVHANAYETIHQRAFIRRGGNSEIATTALVLALLIGFLFWTLAGWKAYLLAGSFLAMAHVIPFMSFSQGVVFPYTTLLSSVWLTTIAAAAFQHVARGRALTQTQEAKQRVEREKARYQDAIRFVTHEMRSPLTTIQGSSEIMGRYKLTDEKRTEMAKTINSESKRLAKMIQTFLDVERISEGEMQMKRSRFPLAALVDACLQRTAALAGQKNLALERLDIADVEMDGDQELLEYALYNLINNAIKYSTERGHVQVQAAMEGRFLRLAVRDDGIGIDAADLSKVFDKFYRTERAERSGVAGTGIGLSIVHQIVAHHDGRMEVESAPGEGTCFTMVLPAAVAVQGQHA